MMQAIESAVLCANLLVAPSRSLWLVGFIYVASMVATLPFAAWKVDDIQVKASWWDGPTARLLVAGWLPGALINVFNTSQIYLSRLAVGVFADTTEVAVLYAGIAISSIFVMPVTILAQLVLSLLGGTNRFVLPYPRALVYYVGVLTFSIVVSLASWLAGRWLIELLYPDVAARTMTFYHWIAISNGCASLMMMLRSVAIKYAPLGKTTFWTGIVLVVQIAALLVLVPRMQSAGAAVAVALSALVSAVIWSVYFFWIVSYYGRSAEST
jgi:hypothetical protein